MKAVSYRPGLLKRLEDPKYAGKVLSSSFSEACADGNWEAFGLMLQDVISAQGSKREFAKKARISRQHLYRIFGKAANPTIKTLLPILNSLGLTLTIAEDAEVSVSRKRA